MEKEKLLATILHDYERILDIIQRNGSEICRRRAEGDKNEKTDEIIGIVMESMENITITTREMLEKMLGFLSREEKAFFNEEVTGGGSADEDKI